jgi:hypothetical protein
MSVAPATYLVAEDPKPAGRACPDRAFGDDAALLATASRTGACSITNRAVARRTSSAEWYRSHAGRRAARAAAASNTRPLRRTKWPPAPSGNQYRSTAAAAPSGSAAALAGMPVPDVVTRQRSQVRSICDDDLDRPDVKALQADPA